MWRWMRGRVVYIPSAQRACCVARSPPFVIKAQSRGSKPRFGSFTWFVAMTFPLFSRERPSEYGGGEAGRGDPRRV